MSKPMSEQMQKLAAQCENECTENPLHDRRGAGEIV